jgi:hypothetical protein
MSDNLLDDSFVECIAKSIARQRLRGVACDAISDLSGVDVTLTDKIEHKIDLMFDLMFDDIWSGTSDNDRRQRETYYSDARAAINAINLKLLTSPE